MPFQSVTIANEFLRIAQAHGEALTSMKLQKLVFYAHGWSLALADKPLILNRIEAWDYGPVIPDLYHEFKKYGNGPIVSPAQEWVLRDRKIMLAAPTLSDAPESAERESAEKIIQRTWQLYGRFTATRLSNATHAPGTPWETVYRPGERHILIPNPIIKTYFEGLARG
jgi:uncharacterized phage-associated protein